MFGIHDLALFILSGFLLNLAPGPDSLLIMAKTGARGWRAGSVTTLGICSGMFVHIVAAALGLSALLASSALAFTVIKIAGGAYLIYMGVKALLSKASSDTGTSAPTVNASQSYRQMYLQGFMTNALNPKVALFFLAFVPQFIAHDASHKALAFVILGLIFCINSLIYCHILVGLTAIARQKIKSNGKITAILNKVLGTLFISLGVKLALASRS
ncbi:LysE family translocator [Shewanella sp. C32]|uniref:LysE family translocator n=1 Tax=Shewanella electrica TaxID=515560 RepID=A0ABT2FKC6_9GAMM|nr:LysE family translocator [Shewanella electrica]MCH1923580.1 LysE family translocator [Shewanella electrica]MCS4555676.1 LysE family translocator [Shewanella electrica]